MNDCIDCRRTQKECLAAVYRHLKIRNKRQIPEFRRDRDAITTLQGMESSAFKERLQAQVAFKAHSELHSAGNAAGCGCDIGPH
jgi:hypothetical protein